jgi:glutathione S-transferase
MIQLYIANKNYSSWSMRPWVLLRQAGIDFEEVYVRFDSFAPDSQFKTALKGVNPVGKVPVLVHDGLAVWDTLAIAEYVANNSRIKNCGLKSAPPGPAPAVSALKCTAGSRACAAPAP